ncbi:MAG: MATE family efflux transporter [Planctomycetes bacterium]|nr:MATE family efflux transporter [Planctomycetota bacterium]
MTDKSLLSRSHIADETSLKYMLKLAAPMIMAYLSFTIMQFVDRFMVSRLGTEELAAVLPAGLIGFVPASFAMGVMTSVTTFVSQSLGRGEKRNCSNYFWQAIYMGLIYMAIVVAVIWPMAPKIFEMLGHETAVADMEVVYLRIMLYAQFMAVFIWASSQFFMGVHRPIITMYTAIVAQLINVAANYVLIFGKFGFPKMGIEGAAWGTFIGIGVGASLKMLMLLTGDINKTFSCRKMMKIDFAKMKNLLKVGLPAGFGLMANIALWGILLFALVGQFGKEAMAATSAVFSCINVSVMPIVGIAAALTAAVGKAIGEGKKHVAIKQTSVCLKVGLVYMGLIGICFFVFRNSLMAFWSGDDKVIAAGVNILICAAIFQVFDAATIIYNGALRGAGDTVWLMFCPTVSGVVILGIGGFLTAKFFPQLGSLGPWMAATASIIAIGSANRWRFKSNKWKKIDLFKHQPLAVPVEIDAVVE